MGIGARSDSAGAGDGRTPRHNREAPAVPYRERAGNILEHSPCFAGRSTLEPLEKSPAMEPGWESWDCPAWKRENSGKILGASSSAQRGGRGLGQRHGMAGKGGMALSWKRGHLGGKLGRNSCREMRAHPNTSHPGPGSRSIPRCCKIWNIPHKNLEKSLKRQQNPRQTQSQPSGAVLPKTTEQKSKIHRFPPGNTDGPRSVLPSDTEEPSVENCQLTGK